MSSQPPLNGMLQILLKFCIQLGIWKKIPEPEDERFKTSEAGVMAPESYRYFENTRTASMFQIALTFLFLHIAQIFFQFWIDYHNLVITCLFKTEKIFKNKKVRVIWNIEAVLVISKYRKLSIRWLTPISQTTIKVKLHISRTTYHVKLHISRTTIIENLYISRTTIIENLYIRRTTIIENLLEKTVPESENYIENYTWVRELYRKLYPSPRII